MTKLDMFYCQDCGVDRIMNMGFGTCPKCDVAVYGFTNDFNPKPDTLYCQDCGVHRIANAGVRTCPKCGTTVYGFINPFIPQIWMRQKSRHSRLKYSRRRVEDAVGYRHADVVTHDFMEVIRVMMDNSLIKGKNVSKYGYYIIRLASRRDIEIGELSDRPNSQSIVPNDLKPGKTKQVFDDRLFGEVYRILGWEPLDCPYYLEWVTKRGLKK